MVHYGELNWCGPMRCSSCSEEVHPVVVTDIDGTLAEYHRTFARFCSNYWHRSVPFDLWDGSGEFEDYLGLSKSEYRQAKLAFRQGGRKRSMPSYPGAVSFTDKVKSLTAELWVLTARPWLLHDAIDPDTQWWLDINGIKYDYLVYGEYKYRELCDRIDPRRIVFMLEDLAEEYASAEELFPGKVYQIERPHNQAAPCLMPRRLVSMAQAAAVAAQAIGEWRERYDIL